MVLALWMEEFPVDQEIKETEEDTCCKKVGAVLVLPNEMLYAVDCTRNGVHGVARLLMAHQDILQDCKVFVSRKPCALCTKLLVQSTVKRVFYLPIEPEYYSEDEKKYEEETSYVDNLFKVSATGQSVFVPKVGQEVLNEAEAKKKTPKKARDKTTARLMKDYWDKNWMANAKDKLPWPAFDKKMQTQVRNDFQSLMQWMARILVGQEKGGYRIQKVSSAQNEDMPFNPEEHSLERQQAEHLITLAKFLAERTDDPRKGVGAVIINEKKEIVALGWNGFSTKALYGEFPRASDKDTVPDRRSKKYPYIIHAEQNALLMRNTKNISGGTLFVTMTPCNDCTPLLEMHGIKTVVLGEKMRNETKESLDYKKFCDKALRANVFICFEMVSATMKRKICP